MPSVLQPKHHSPNQAARLRKENGICYHGSRFESIGWLENTTSMFLSYKCWADCSEKEGICWLLEECWKWQGPRMRSPRMKGGPAGAWAGCQVRAEAVGGTGAEAASIFLHEGDIDRGATKRMACQNKWERIVPVFHGKRAHQASRGSSCRGGKQDRVCD